MCSFLLLFFKVSTGEIKVNNTCSALYKSALKITEKCEVTSELLRFNVIVFHKIQSQKNTRPHLECSILLFYLSKEFICQSGVNILLIRFASEKINIHRQQSETFEKSSTDLRVHFFSE